MIRGLLLLIVIQALTAVRLQAQCQWFKGNLHVHTSESDGTATPEEVTRWYRDHGYAFVALTDHDVRTPVETLKKQFDTPGEFMILAGVEVSDRVDRCPVHLNGLGVRETVTPQGGGTVTEVINRNLDAIRSAGGLAVLNHPNGLLSAALEVDEIAASRVEHFEVCCADYRGGSGHPSTDDIWDGVLGRGRRLFGIAVDDAHEFDREARDPGSAWVMVWAGALRENAILAALREGRFYATTGVRLEQVTAVDGTRLCLAISQGDGYGFRTFFIGGGGRVLAVDETAAPCYELREQDPYVRARVERSDGALAWVQPLWRSNGP